MLGTIYKGNNGTVFDFTVKDNGTIVDIRGATVSVKLQKADKSIVNKIATITDGEHGKCEMTLTSADLSVEGMYFFQALVTFADGDLFFADIVNFPVASTL